MQSEFEIFIASPNETNFIQRLMFRRFSNTSIEQTNLACADWDGQRHFNVHAIVGEPWKHIEASEIYFLRCIRRENVNN